MDWSSLIPGRNLTNADLVKELIQEKRVQHPRAVQSPAEGGTLHANFPQPTGFVHAGWTFSGYICCLIQGMYLGCRWTGSSSSVQICMRQTHIK